MEESKERINLITEYISAYEGKIRLANQNHLFDEAVIFELFAKEICKIWFGQSFSNLNLVKPGYPCVDLISEDKTLYVQVSTQNDIFTKIKSTLKSLVNTNKPELTNITSPVFFVLSNESEHNVKDLIGEEQIGKYPFTVKDHLISTSRILQRAVDDLDFQIELYELLKRDIDGVATTTGKLISLFERAKSVGLASIDNKINSEYEIDRTELIRRIKNDDNQYCLICGDAGSGKSALCKMLLKDETRVLFVRADKLEKCSSIDDIWDVNICQSFNYLKSEKLFIYIDALEYISGSGESVKELLQDLLFEIGKHSNLHFIASCRTCDARAFFKFIGAYKFKEYTVDNITDDELKSICDKYPIIRELSLSRKHAELLCSPFYINVIVTKGIRLSELSDVNGFRNYIWKECICLDNKTIEMRIPSTDVVDAIEHIVFERAKRKTIGIDETEIDSNILKFLRSNNVVTAHDSMIRLKYDIYEDICFERKLDKLFDSCRGVYSLFFDNIENMGNGAYRRYQIWVSNKLLAKVNRDKFLYKLVFNNSVSDNWRRNTIIGIVKSPFCKSFFDEQETNLIDHQVVREFIEITNLFAFDMIDYYSDDYKSLYYLRLKACGYGRIALINLISNNGENISEAIEKNKIIKLCKDYATRSDHEDKTDELVCSLICRYLEEYQIGNAPIEENELDSFIYPMLEIIYSLPMKAHSWIKEYWTKLKNCYLNGGNQNSRAAADIMSWTLKHAKRDLVDALITDLLDVAETIWTYETERDRKRHELYGYGLSDEYYWGIKGVGASHQHDYHKVENMLFLQLILRRNFKCSLEWIITLINKMVTEYTKNCPDKISTVVLYDCENNIQKSYTGSVEMWFAGREEHTLPTLLGDIVYWLKETTIQMLNECKADKKLFAYFASFVKKTILDKTTNVIPFVVIEEIGFEFPDLLPAYATVLASSPIVLFWDIQWTVHSISTPAQAILKKQISMSLGVPNLEERYPHKDYNFCGLQDYVALNQLTNSQIARERSIATLEYLYKIVDSTDAKVLLQIQKMDMRDAEVHIKDDSTIIIEPHLTEGPHKIVEENAPNLSAEESLINSIKELFDSKKTDDLEEVLGLLNDIKALMNTDESKVNFENYYIMILAIILNNSSLSKEKRTEIVCDWSERINNVITRKSSYVADLNLSPILFNQYGKDIETVAKNRLKKFMLDCLIACSYDGQIITLRRMVVDYLLKDEHTAQIIFNTIINLADDEWKHSSYNQKLLQKNKKKRYSIPASYRVPTSDEIIEALKLKQFNSKREKIIDTYLYNEKKTEVDKMNINHLDPGYLFIATNVGLSLTNKPFHDYCKKVMPIFIQVIHNEEINATMKTYYQRLRVKELFERELINDKGDYKLAVNLLFDEVDYEKFDHETNKTYISIFEHVYSTFFDSYNNTIVRKLCRDCIKYTETKIDKISISFVKHELERILVFSTDYMWSDWNKCETHYSYDDKVFMCDLWKKYCLGHENTIIRTIYQMKTGELLPEILTAVTTVVDSLEKKGERPCEECSIILKTIVLRSLLGFSDRIKSDDELHNAFERILTVLISQGDECAAVILDEYSTH